MSVNDEPTRHNEGNHGKFSNFDNGSGKLESVGQVGFAAKLRVSAIS